jgi:hypothetical protein
VQGAGGGGEGEEGGVVEVVGGEVEEDVEGEGGEGWFLGLGLGWWVVGGVEVLWLL